MIQFLELYALVGGICLGVMRAGWGPMTLTDMAVTLFAWPAGLLFLLFGGAVLVLACLSNLAELGERIEI